MTLREIRQDFNKNLLKNFNIVSQLLEEVMDQMNHSYGRRFIGRALEVLKPLPFSLGIRIRKLNQFRIEMAFRNPKSRENPESKDSLIIYVSELAAKMLIKESFGESGLLLHLKDLKWTQHHQSFGELKCRVEISEITRETLWLRLQKQPQADLEVTSFIFDEQERLVAETLMTFTLHRVELLDWK